jgi:hypothetical protein
MEWFLLRIVKGGRRATEQSDGPMKIFILLALISAIAAASNRKDQSDTREQAA